MIVLNVARLLRFKPTLREMDVSANVVETKKCFAQSMQVHSRLHTRVGKYVERLRPLRVRGRVPLSLLSLGGDAVCF
jgi:hypothetical protein